MTFVVPNDESRLRDESIVHEAHIRYPIRVFVDLLTVSSARHSRIRGAFAVGRAGSHRGLPLALYRGIRAFVALFGVGGVGSRTRQPLLPRRRHARRQYDPRDQPAIVGAPEGVSDVEGVRWAHTNQHRVAERLLIGEVGRPPI